MAVSKVMNSAELTELCDLYCFWCGTESVILMSAVRRKKVVVDLQKLTAALIALNVDISMTSFPA